MNLPMALLRWALLLSSVAAAFYALPGVFVPGAAADLIGVRAPASAVWPAFAFLLTLLVSLFQVVAAWDPARNLATVWLCVLSRFAGAATWFALFPERPLAGWLDLAFGVTLLLLAVAAARGPSAETA